MKFHIVIPLYHNPMVRLLKGSSEHSITLTLLRGHGIKLSPKQIYINIYIDFIYID